MKSATKLFSKWVQEMLHGDLRARGDMTNTVSGDGDHHLMMIVKPTSGFYKETMPQGASSTYGWNERAVALTRSILEVK